MEILRQPLDNTNFHLTVIFFEKVDGYLNFFRNFVADKASHPLAGRVKNIDGILTLSTPFVRTAEGKGRFLNVTCLCKSNFATLNPSTAVMQRGVRVGVLYPNDSLLLFYIKV